MWALKGGPEELQEEAFVYVVVVVDSVRNSECGKARCKICQRFAAVDAFVFCFYLFCFLI